MLRIKDLEIHLTCENLNDLVKELQSSNLDKSGLTDLVIRIDVRVSSEDTNALFETLMLIFKDSNLQSISIATPVVFNPLLNFISKSGIFPHLKVFNFCDNQYSETQHEALRSQLLNSFQSARKLKGSDPIKDVAMNKPASITKSNHMPAPALPAKIHLVWVGGPILPGYLQMIQHLAAVAHISQVEVNLWVDDIRNIIKTACKDDIYIKGLHIRNITELEPGMLAAADFYGVDNRLRQFTNCVQRELIGLKNKAAASDFLRMEILRQEGGYYLDTDTRFLLDAENNKFELDHANYGFLANGKCGITRESHPDIVSCNDIIAAVPDNPIVKDIILKCLQNYADYDETPIIFVPKNRTKAAVVKDKHTLSKMDIKRIPAKSTIVEADGSVRLIGLHHATIHRHSLTIDASGPTNISLAFADRISSMPVQMRSLNFINHSLFFNKTANDETILAGKVICNARPSFSWIKEGRPTKAFDDTAMQDSQACLQRMINPKK